jgi:hypothetical protein
MTESNTPSKSRWAALGTGFLGLLTCGALLSGEIRGWLGLSTQKSTEVGENSQQAQVPDVVKSQTSAGPADEKITQTKLAPADATVAKPSRVLMSVNSLRLKVNGPTNHSNLDVRAELSITFENRNDGPVALIWINPYENARLEIEGVSTLKRLQDTGGIQYCRLADAGECWQRMRSKYITVAAGDKFRATLEFRDNFPSGDLPRLTIARSAVLLSALHVADPITGSGPTQNISMSDVQIDNQVPKI